MDAIKLYSDLLDAAEDDGFRSYPQVSASHRSALVDASQRFGDFRLREAFLRGWERAANR